MSLVASAFRLVASPALSAHDPIDRCLGEPDQCPPATEPVVEGLIRPTYRGRTTQSKSTRSTALVTDPARGKLRGDRPNPAKVQHKTPKAGIVVTYFGAFPTLPRA